MRIAHFLDRKSCCLIVLCTIILILSLILLFPNTSSANAESMPQKPLDKKAAQSCGPLSLVTALSLLGRSVDASTCAKLAGSDDVGMTTLAGLQNAVESLGEHSKGMHLKPDELALINRPAILHVSLPSDRIHFVVFVPGNDASFDLIDPTRGKEKESYTAEQLHLMWDGDCLVFTPTPIMTSIKIGIWRVRGIIAALAGLVSGLLLAVLLTPKLPPYCRFPSGIHLATARWPIVTGLCLFVVIIAGVTVFSLLTIMNDRPLSTKPRLVLGATTLNLGEIQIGQASKVSTWLGNRGRHLLKIDKKKIKPSCRCLRISLSKSELRGGDKSSLQIGLNPQYKIGPFQYSVLIPSNDPEENNKVLNIKGQVTGLTGVVYPPRLYFGRVRDTEDVLKTLVYYARRPEFDVLNVTSDSPLVTCNFRKFSSVFKVNVSLTELPKLGPFKGTIKIVTNDPESDHTETEIPFYGEVIPKETMESRISRTGT